MSRALVFVGIALTLAACASSRPGDGAGAIARVLAVDEELGAIRNHAPETGPLHVGLEDYVAGLAALDTSGCPDDFVTALASHRRAWEESIPFFARFADERGELHELFERIRARGGEDQASLEAHETRIWDTWAVVEAAAGR